MTELQALYQKKGEVIHQMRDMYTQIEKEGRSFSEEEDSKFKKMDDDLKAIQARIDKGEQLRSLTSEYEKQMESAPTDQAELRSLMTEGRTGGSTTKSNVDPKVEADAAFRHWLQTGEVRSVLLPYRTNVGRMGKNPEVRGTDPQVSSTAAAGGYLSPEIWANEIIVSMKAFGGMLEAGNIMFTKSGDTLHFPTRNTTTQKGSIIAQAVADDIADIAWGETTMGAFTYTSGIVLIGEELLEDEEYGATREVQEIITERLQRIANEHLTTGAGTTLPFGAVTQAAAGKTGASQTAVTRAEILDLIGAVDPAYRIGAKVGLMMNDATLTAIKKLSVGSGDDRPLWVPSMRDGAPDRIEGYQYWINQDMATMAAGAKSMLFGDFSKYRIRMVRGIATRRSAERYWERRSVAYFATMRMDGKLMDTAAVKYFINAA